MGGGHGGVDLVDELVEIGFHLVPVVAELFHAGQDLDGNHAASVHFFFLDEAIAEFRVLIERFFDALGADVFAVREDDEVLDAAHDVHVAFFVEAYEIASLDPTVFGQRLGGLLGVAVIAEEYVVATIPQLAVDHLGFLLGIELTYRGGMGQHVDVAGREVGAFGHAVAFEELDA